jgi:hypothetical protein
MDDEKDVVIATFKGRLPRRRVSSRDELLTLLGEFDWLLRAKAQHIFSSPADIDEVMRHLRFRMEGVAEPHFEHALQVVTHALWLECYKLRARRAREPQEWREARVQGISVDPVLGPLTGAKLEALALLSPRQRLRVERACGGWRPVETAAAEGRTPGVIRLGLHSAREQLLQLAEKIDTEKQKDAPAFLLLALLVRVRRGIARRLQGLAGLAPQPAVALVPTLACAVIFTSTLGPSTGHLGAGAAADAQDFGGAHGMATHVDPHAEAAIEADFAPSQANLTAQSAPSQSRERSSSPGSLPLQLPRPRSPAEETPEDTQLTAAAASSGGTGGTPALVGLGMGRSCACSVLFESRDGGASWHAAAVPAPPDAIQVAIPVGYPRDPRIFLGSDASSGVAAYVVPRFGELAMPLPGGPGRVALAGHFDTGDPRVFVAGRAAVVTVELDVRPPRADPVIAYPAGGVPASLATPGSGTAAMLMLAPVGSVMAATGMSVLDAPTILACASGVAGGCERSATAPPDALALATPPSGPQAAAAWPSGLGVSSDGGRTFTVTAAPPGTSLGPTLALSGGRTWAVLTSRTQTTVAWTDSVRWHDAAAVDPLLRSARALVAVPGQRLLALLIDGGLRCTGDGGLSWHPRCP